MSIVISAEYHDGIASTAFYPKKNPMKVATGPTGSLAAGGWTADTWAVVVQIWCSKSDGSWESQIAPPLGGFIPASPSVSTRAVDHSYVATWTNTTASYAIFVEAQIKISGVWTADWTQTTAVNATFSARHFYTGGENVRFRCRYTAGGGSDGDWTDYVTGIIPA